MMISLFPHTGTINPLTDVAKEERPSSAKSWVFTNMVASLDGATAIDEVSRGLGTPSDSELFVALRSISDVILVGSGTVNAERYQPPRLFPEAIEQRRLRGQPERPTVVVVSRKLSFDPSIPLFNSPEQRPILATTTTAPRKKLATIAPQCEIIQLGAEDVDLPQLLEELYRRGHTRVLSEGGPTLNNQLISLDLIDEWNLSISPLLAGGSSARAAQGPTTIESPATMRLDRVWQGDDMLFGRWIRKRD